MAAPFSGNDPRARFRLIRNRRGQIVVEYILLLVIGVTVAAVLVRGLASRSETNPGVVVKRWKDIQQEIGNDLIDKCVGDLCNQ